MLKPVLKDSEPSGAAPRVFSSSDFIVSSVSAEYASQRVDARLVGAAIAGSFWCDGYGDLVPVRVSLASFRR